MKKENDVFAVALPKRGRWIGRHKNAVSGMVCILASIILAVGLFSELGTRDFDINKWLIFIGVMVLGLYLLVKGVSTLLFHRKESEFGQSVCSRLLVELQNQLFFVYERLFWVWVLLPLLMITVPFLIKGQMGGDFVIPFGYWAVAGVMIVLSSLLFGRPLLLKKRKLKKKIGQLKNDVLP